MSPRLMSEPQAWREIARLIHEKPIYGPYMALGKVLRGGASDYDWQLMERMEVRCAAFYPAAHAPGADPVEVKILAALFLALEAEDESRRVSPPGGAR